MSKDDNKKPPKYVPVTSGADYLHKLSPADRAWLNANTLPEDLRYIEQSIRHNLTPKQRKAIDRVRYKQRVDALNKGALRVGSVLEESVDGDCTRYEIEAGCSNPEDILIAKQAVYEKVQRIRNGRQEGRPRKINKEASQKALLEEVAEAFQPLCLPRPTQK